MKHSIRERIVDPIRGKIVKVSTINAELGSGITDKNGKEIFEGDIVQLETFEKENSSVEFHDGAFWLDNRVLSELPVIYYPTLEVVGHVDD